MRDRRCARCSMPLDWRQRADARFCSARCRAAAHRSRREPIPLEMRNLPRWTRRDGKRPITTTGAPASSTSWATWTTYEDAARSSAGDGLGVMLGYGLGCYDLDHVTDEQAAAFAATVPERIVYAERSMSGGGVHLFIEADESAGWRGVRDGISVERYTWGRFIAVTGDTWEAP